MKRYESPNTCVLRRHCVPFRPGLFELLLSSLGFPFARSLPSPLEFSHLFIGSPFPSFEFSPQENEFPFPSFGSPFPSFEFVNHIPWARPRRRSGRSWHRFVTRDGANPFVAFVNVLDCEDAVKKRTGVRGVSRSRLRWRFPGWIMPGSPGKSASACGWASRGRVGQIFRESALKCGWASKEQGASACGERDAER